jgi:hypothetical protein
MRIAIILPQRRLGVWHKQLAKSLSRKHDVAIFVDGGAPAYGMLLRAWLRAERLLYHGDQVASWGSAAGKFRCSRELDDSQYDVVIDIAENRTPRRNSITVRYNGCADSVALIERLTVKETPHLTVCKEGLQIVLAESRPAIDDKTRLSRGLQLSFSRCISLLERALRPTASVRKESQVAVNSARSPRLSSYIIHSLAAKAVKVAHDWLVPTRDWAVAIRNRHGAFVPISDNGQHYFADPFLFTWSDRTFLFLEDYHRGTKNGLISAVEIIDGKPAGVPTPVLERSYHLSYPFVFAQGDSVYMLPETTTNRTLELYQAVDFPWKWQLDSVLIEGLALADATPIFHQGRWWLFASMAEHGTTDHDELFIFYSDRLSGPWQPHSSNPVKSDCRSSRPAGRILRQGNRLYRPAQNCERSYGSGLVWNEIVELTPLRFHEIEVVHVNPPRALGIDGVHSFDQTGQLQVIDFRHTRRWGRGRVPPHQALLRLNDALDLACEVVMSPAGIRSPSSSVLGFPRALRRKRLRLLRLCNVAGAAGGRNPHHH